MQPIRRISTVEKNVLDYLISIATVEIPRSQTEDLFVQSMNDGGMGSFRIYQTDSELEVNRNFGSQVSEYQYLDDDKVPVLVSLNLDQYNNLFEVDIWKINFSSVSKIKTPS